MMRAVRCSAVMALLLLRGVALAQTAPELNGRVHDLAGAPIAGALIELIEANLRTWSDASGDFQLRAPEDGRYTVRVSRLGFAPGTFEVRLTAGTATTLPVRLLQRAFPLDSLLVVGAPAAEHAGTITRTEIVRSGASTAADAIAALPAVVVSATTPGGPQRVSIRGAEARQVLVLLDGSPLNDPVTGEADLSRIRAELIERITVLPGGASARYGARALGGVVVIETRTAGSNSEVSAATGSLGLLSGSLIAGGAAPLAWSLGVNAQRLDGAFDYALPDAAGGMRGERGNADARAADAFAQLQWQGSVGQLRFRAAVQDDKRGMPGTAFAPSLHARQRATSIRTTAQWQAPERYFGTHALIAYTHERLRFSDAHPPAGVPYDDTLSLGELYARLAARSNALPLTISGAIDAHGYDIETSTLETAARAPGSLGAGAEVQWPRTGSNRPWFAQAQLRVERDHGQARTFSAHALSIGYDGPLHARVSQRSSYAPPTLADQHFRESFGVAANPNLRAERVPREVEAQLSWNGTIVGANVGVRTSAWRGNTDDLIVWLPDYRFIWSPRNTDVRRRGGEASLTVARGLLALDAAWSYSKVTYREFADPDVQVVYRPRHTGTLALQASRARWHMRAEARYTGARNTAPTNLNALPGFWSVNTSAGARVIFSGFPLDAQVSLDRINNETESLIFGFPQPARVLRIELRASPKVHP